MEEADQVFRARLLAVTRRESELWLHTLPTSTVTTILYSKSLRIALRLDADVCMPHKCHCDRRMDSRELQALFQVLCWDIPKTCGSERFH